MQVEETPAPPVTPPPKRRAYEPKSSQTPIPSPKVPQQEVVVKPSLPHELSKEVQIYFEKMKDAIGATKDIHHNILEKPDPSKKPETIVIDKEPEPLKNDVFVALTEKLSKKKPELGWKDIFFVLNCRNNNSLRVFVWVLQSLCQDPGLYKLLPYIIEFICDNVPKSVNNLGYLKSLMQVVSTALL